MSLVMIDQPLTYGEAYGLRAFIEAHGFYCTVFDFNHFATNWYAQHAIGGLRLMVTQEDLAGIQELVENVRQQTAEKPIYRKHRAPRPLIIEARLSTAFWVCTSLFLSNFLSVPIFSPRRRMRRARLIYRRYRP